MNTAAKIFFHFFALFGFLSVPPFLLGQSMPPHALDYTYKFDHYSSKDGLSQSSVQCFFQDSKGFMWIGTGGGLNHFDGYNFSIYKNVPDDSSSLSNNNISTIAEDNQGYIWIGTFDGGLNRFNPNTEKFARYVEDFSDSTALNGNTINKIFVDSKSRIWIVASGNSIAMLLLYNPDNNNFQRYRIEYGKIQPKNIALQTRTLYEDRYGKLWVGTQHGIFIFDPDKKEFIHKIVHDPENKNSLLNNAVTSLFESTDGSIWVGRSGFADGGLSKIQLNNSTYDLDVKNFKQDLNKVLHNGNSIIDNGINDLAEDHSQKIWIGTNWGLSVLNPKDESFLNIKENSLNPFTIQSNKILAVYKDRTGNIWLGYSGSGLSKLRHNKGFIHIQQRSVKSTGLLSNNVLATLQDKQNNLWVATLTTGLNKIIFSDTNYNIFKVIQFEQNFSENALERDDIFSLYEDKQGFIWAGTYGGGLFRYNGVAKGFKHYGRDPNHLDASLGNEEVRVLCGENDTSFWVGTNMGLFLLKESANSKVTFTRYYPVDSIPSTTSNARFQDLVKDNFDNIWAVTYQGKILYFDRNIRQFKEPSYTKSPPTVNIYTAHISFNKFLWIGTTSGLLKFEIINAETGPSLNLLEWYTDKNGLPDMSIYKILEDQHHNLWVSHSAGLSKFDIQNENFKNYQEADGLQGNQFNVNAGTCLKGGYLCFGGATGINIFHPDSLKDNIFKPFVQITQIQTSNDKISHSSSEEKIIQKHWQNIISFEFATLDFTVPYKNQYAYQMVGFDDDWVYSGNKRTATYTNLDPGTYTFRVKGANSDGLWNEEGASMEIVILTPRGRTWWAYSLYTLSGIMIMILVVLGILRRVRLRSRLQLKEMEAQKYHELNTLKSRFFANISHEFRTPLTLILGPVEKWLSKTTDPQRKAELKVIHRNAFHLLRLVNQLLDLSRLEAGTIKMKCKKGNLNLFISSIISQFSSMADSKKINFTFDSQDEISMFYDADKLEKIIFNLLSNAFKFTPEHGIITVSLTKDEKQYNQFEDGFAEIRVADSGIGIKPAYLEKIFDRFYQVDNTMTREFEGSGIGLALTKELVGLHHGIITVSSTPGNGTCFVLKLPLGSRHLQDDEIDHSESVTAMPRNPEVLTADDPIAEMDTSPEDPSLAKVLIVEDNADLRTYLRNNLNNDYFILEASDGEQGYIYATTHIPDLIISDLMMPKMDGLQLCNKLKVDERTSHIPIIILTAKADHNTRMEGYETGADDYIAKPFDFAELCIRIQNLIVNRIKLREKYARKLINPKPKEVTIDSVEDKFLQKVMLSIEKYMDDSNFNVDKLADEVAMSQVQLYRKLKALTGFNTNDIIRNMRLERAADLLLHRAGNVAEIAYQVGFNNLSYFAKCFKVKFGKSPSEILSSVKGIVA